MSFTPELNRARREGEITQSFAKRVNPIAEIAKDLSHDHHWFSPLPEISKERITEAQVLVQEYKDALAIFRQEEGAFYDAENTAIFIAGMAGSDDQQGWAKHYADFFREDIDLLKSAYQEDWDEEIYRKFCDQVAEDIRRAIVWATDPKFRKLKNPFLVKLKMYEAGMIEPVFCKVDGEEKYVAHFAMSNFSAQAPYQYMLGCWVEGDDSVKYWHIWTEGCANLFNRSPKMTDRSIEPLDLSYHYDHSRLMTKEEAEAAEEEAEELERNSRYVPPHRQMLLGEAIKV